MIPLLFIAIIEKLAFDHSKYEANTSTSSILFALMVFTIVCGIIIFICRLFEKPSDITVKIAEINEEDVPSYYDEWEGEGPFVIMCIIYGLISLITLALFADAAFNDEEYIYSFLKFAVLFLIVDIIIVILIRKEIAPDIFSSIAGMIHFETTYMMRAVWIIAFIWGMLYLTVITILVGGIIWSLITWVD